MTSPTCSELELLIYLHFPVAATGINKEACPFDVASGPFKWPSGALMWPCGTLKKSKKKKKNEKELIKPIECSDMLVFCFFSKLNRSAK